MEGKLKCPETCLKTSSKPSSGFDWVFTATVIHPEEKMNLFINPVYFLKSFITVSKGFQPRAPKLYCLCSNHHFSSLCAELVDGARSSSSLRGWLAVSVKPVRSKKVSSSKFSLSTTPGCQQSCGVPWSHLTLPDPQPTPGCASPRSPHASTPMGADPSQARGVYTDEELIIL